MAAIDDFSALLFEEAKAFLEKAKTATSSEARTAYLHASLLVGFCSFEAHLNSIADDFLTRPELGLLDQSILSEKKVELKGGEYALTNQLQMFRMDDRIEYLLKRFSTTPLDKNARYWGEFKAATKLRNELTHPKTPPLINIDSTERALESILDLLDVMYKSIYKRRHPSYNLGMDTQITF